MRIQWTPNLIRDERRLCLTRIKWERGKVGDGKGYSSKLSISLCFVPADLWVGLFLKRGMTDHAAYLCLLPMLPIRFHLVRSYGGIIA